MIVAFCGSKPLCGKSTCADYVANKFKSQRMEFSTPIKVMCQHLFGIGENYKENDADRKILQEFGLFCKAIDPFFWCYRGLIS